MTLNFITLDEYKSYVGLSKNTEDVKISFLISAASDIIKAYLGKVFPDQLPIIENLSVDYDTDRIYPTYYPITNIISVEESSRITNDSSIHVLESDSQYYLDSDGSIVRVPGDGFYTWPQYPKTIKVTYEGGYSVDEAPEAIKLATVELVSYYLNRDFIPSKSMQGASIVNPVITKAELPAHIRAILDYYKV